MTRRIILEENKQPQLEGEWTIGAVLAAAEFLRRWIEGQQIAVQPAPEAPSLSEIEGRARDAIVRDAISS